MNNGSDEDPKGLIEEAYLVDGITDAECRSIFLDWALSLHAERDTRADLKKLLDRYAAMRPEHPMTALMHQGLGSMPVPRRRGGWRSRFRN